MPGERILIVEDERIVAEEIRVMLSAMDFEITGVVSTGPDAIREASETLPDLVLMDIRLKGDMDGVEAAGIIAERSGIPAIYLTAYADDATVQRARLTRPLGYIVKPLERSQVKAVIEVALYRYRREKMLAESERWLSATLQAIDNGIIAINDRGEINYMNAAACMLMGVPLPGANGKQIDEIISIADIYRREIVPDFFRKIISVKPSRSNKGIAVLVSKDGYEIPVDYVISPFREEIGQGPGFIVILHDASRRLKIEDPLPDREEMGEDLVTDPLS
ncbi:MAG: two-component response regulator [Methanocella sp. PtaU1.Bin125]|nr:MAG: two-component response regulator [Methanocella sp. PtaU1.Bin125]